ncbi:MAG: alpha/beta hydrolase fold [Betaproteobacteria bacterium]|nr:alpha/beta hydrolase fold [Betaproteobacteria bacterium]
MPYATTDDGVRLYYEEAGSGVPIVFVHEFSGDLRSWEAQIQHFSRHYRCIAFNARGYPPSDVPPRVSSYSHRIAAEDIAAVMRHLKIPKAHIVGCSMGAQSALHFGFTYPRKAITLTAIGAGSRPATTSKAEHLANTEAYARRFEEQGLAAVFERVKVAPNRVQLKRKNPRAWADFARRFAEHSAQGCANTQRGIQGKRPPLASLEQQFRTLKVPTHVVAGDEDTGSIEPALFIKRVCPVARLTIAPATGHLVNTEEPELFNRLTEQFYAEVESRQRRR